ncbi:MAG: tRNA-uridine aminocarboxypropyltransferase [Myxococcales bacterium]|nr:tRNA-uridine aminocarboxypropyltransferase [Myxococcales bacterium]
MHRSLCICGLLPRLTTRTRLLLVLHQLEARKTTNTGRIAALCLAGSRVVVRGRDDRQARQPATEEADGGQPLWSSDSQPILLFPHESAHPIAAWRESEKPVTLIVPDGTWSQAIRARKRIKGLDQVPCARLPEGPLPEAARYRLRHDARPGRLSTLAAIAIAMGELEGPAVRSVLERVLSIMVDRTLWTNGRIKAADVTGGIPEGAKPHDPWGRGQRSVV